jgi:chromosome segregation ATPase
MSESAPPDGVAVERELEGLERAVGSLLEELASLRERALGAEDLERRLRELGDENARLRAVIEEARERAGRIRGRLLVIEDETAD